MWIVSTTSRDSALSTVHEAVTELELGKTEIVDANLYTSDYSITDPAVLKKIESMIERVGNHEDTQLAAWISSNGGLW